MAAPPSDQAHSSMCSSSASVLYLGFQAHSSRRFLLTTKAVTGLEGLVAPSCPTLCDLMDCSPPGSSVHGILQARILGWVALLQGIFPTQGLNPCLLHCRQILYRLSNRGGLTGLGFLLKTKAVTGLPHRVPVWDTPG